MSLSQEILEEMYNLYNQKLELKKLSEKIADYLIKFKIIDIWIEDKFFYFTAIVQLNNFDPVIVESLHIDRIPPIEYYKESSTARSHLIDYFVSQLNVIFREIEMNNKGIFTLDDFELEKGWPSLYAQVREV